MQINYLISRVKLILNNPQANPRAAMLLLGIIITLIIIFIFISYIIYSLRKKDDQLLHKTKDISLKKSFIILGITGFAVIIFSFSFFAYTSQSTFCSNCHVIRPYVQSWKSSTHKKTSCIDCHETREFFGEIKAALNRSKSLYVSLTKKTGFKMTAEVSSKNCLFCHQEAIEKTNVFKGLKVSHLHFTDVYRCTDCHNGVHKEKKDPYVVEALCLTCHRAKKKDKKCSFCHQADVGKRIVTAPRDFKKVQFGGLKSCRGCHSISLCTRCHGVEMPHPESWKEPQNHAKYGVFEGKNKICKKCHDIPDFCNRCHRFPGHYSKWKNDHKTANTSAGCSVVCHQTKNICNLCHKK